jgi:hypothetical protein
MYVPDGSEITFVHMILHFHVASGEFLNNQRRSQQYDARVGYSIVQLSHGSISLPTDVDVST